MAPVVIESEQELGLQFSELVEEVIARGFDDLKEEPGLVRVKRWVNQAYREICDNKKWPFLELSIEGPAPLEVVNLGHVLSVKDGERPLSYLDRRSVADGEGTPTRWYLEGESTINVTPGSTDTLAVNFQVAAPALVADEDRPLVPPLYNDLIVDGAVVRALKNRSEWEGAAALRLEWERGLRQMVHALLHPNYDGPAFVKRTGSAWDYL